MYKANKIPRRRDDNYSADAITERQEFLREQSGLDLTHIAHSDRIRNRSNYELRGVFLAQTSLVPPNLGALGGWGACVSISTQATEAPIAAPIIYTTCVGHANFAYRGRRVCFFVFDSHTCAYSAEEAQSKML